MTGVNLNDYVWVRLTEFGWKVFDDHHRELGLNPGPYRAIIGTPGGYQRIQLWELMQIFGPVCGIGHAAGVFDGMTIWFTDPSSHDAQDRGAS